MLDDSDVKKVAFALGQACRMLKIGDDNEHAQFATLGLETPAGVDAVITGSIANKVSQTTRGYQELVRLVNVCLRSRLPSTFLWVSIELFRLGVRGSPERPAREELKSPGPSVVLLFGEFRDLVIKTCGNVFHRTMPGSAIMFHDELTIEFGNDVGNCFAVIANSHRSREGVSYRDLKAMKGHGFRLTKEFATPSFGMYYKLPTPFVEKWDELERMQLIKAIQGVAVNEVSAYAASLEDFIHRGERWLYQVHVQERNTYPVPPRGFAIEASFIYQKIFWFFA